MLNSVIILYLSKYTAWVLNFLKSQTVSFFAFDFPSYFIY